MTNKPRLLAAALAASRDLPRSYRQMIDCLLMATGGKRRDGSRVLLRLVG